MRLEPYWQITKNWMDEAEGPQRTVERRKYTETKTCGGDTSSAFFGLCVNVGHDIVKGKIGGWRTKMIKRLLRFSGKTKLLDCL